MKLPIHSLAIASAAACLLLPRAGYGESVTEYLRAFHDDPAAVMERLPGVVDENGDAQPQGYIDPTNEEARSSYKNQLRAALGVDPTSAAPLKNDLVQNLVDPGTSVVRNLSVMQEQSLLSLTSPKKPWADSYWPTYRGQIAYRYADKSVSQSKSWAVNYAAAQSNPAAGVVATGNSSLINMLSPAEKYDFVMGDSAFTLTNFAWTRGKIGNDDGSGIATWMGICHGWSAAASMGVPFIGQPTTVVSQSGVPVTFYPQDIKALESMLWANGAPSARFVGGRCTLSHPPRNSNGRILDPNCFDTNPATWHLSVVNQLGRNHRSFVFDGTYTAEVWNFPLVSTKYRYFNPQTLEQTGTWSAARVPLENFTVDKFREFRDKETRSVVGIYMDVTYTIEIEPGTARVFDAPTKTVRYIYDLELDASDNVIGGEWYSNAHPDFIWTFDQNAQAMAFDENVLLADPWANNGPVPLAWTDFARRASARGTPLFAFLKKVTDAAGPVYQP